MLSLLAMKRTSAFKKRIARKQARVPKQLWKMVMLVSYLGSMLTCVVANDEYKVNCAGRTLLRFLLNVTPHPK